MKNLLIVAGLAFYLLSCNNSHDNHKGTGADTSGHEAHKDNSTSANGDNHMKIMHDAMNTMMTRMEEMKPTGDPDYDFAMMMKHHHEAAVEMAQAEVEGGTDADLRAKAQKMVDDQQGEINVFDKVLKGSPTTASSDYGQKAMKMMTPMSEVKMESHSLDAMFASMMIPHHEDGVKMAEAYLPVGRNEELKNIARNIIESQRREINELKAWLENQKN